MKTESLYHVVTERPMAPGQRVFFDENHPNGVWRRVNAFERLEREKAAARPGAQRQPAFSEKDDGLAALIQSDWEKWAKVARRERALERVRREQFPQYPSRMACLYTSRTLAEAEEWARFFGEIGRTVYSIVLLRVTGPTFDGDACNCFDGTGDEAADLEQAAHYWKRDRQNPRPVIETLAAGEIFVEKIIARFSAETQG